MHTPIDLTPRWRRKFVMPGTACEQGTALMLVGLAALVVSAADPVLDRVSGFGAARAEGQRVAIIPYRGALEQRLVGVYLFRDEDGTLRPVQSRRVRMFRADVPARITVVWQPGRPEEARTVGEHEDRWLGALAGALILAGGLWLRLRRPAAAPVARPTVSAATARPPGDQ